MNNHFINRLAIGTTKLGMPYGAIEAQQVKETTVEKIFIKAQELGFTCFDTAPSYGNAEQLIGKYLVPKRKSFCVTKVAKIADTEINKKSLLAIEDKFHLSLQHMRTDTCYGLLVHDVQDLYKPGAEQLIKWMQSLKEKGLVTKIGVSVYTPEEAQELYARFKFDLIQLPCNIYDQRFLQSDVLNMLASQQVEIHARSLFLKGLILKPNTMTDLPSHFPQGLLAHNQHFHHTMQQKNITTYDACLAFAKQHSIIDRWVIGVSSEKQLTQLLNTEKHITQTIDFEQWVYTEEQALDPRTW